ncbi:MAG: dihydropteroate synthase [Candidatus Omnitrophota bacterium]
MSDIKDKKRTCIMGVINATPDSFSDGGRYAEPRLAAERAREMAEAGAEIIDIGGESSRPGTESVSLDEELGRVLPVIKAIRQVTDIALSVDTYKSEVARQALEEGASIVNDITALRQDPEMARTIAGFDAGVVLMHMKGSPRTMQEAPSYEDVVGEIIEHLSESIKIAQDAGIDPEKIIVDPGIGFGKKLEHNLAILKNLSQLKKLEKPILVGTSRKSFIGELTGKEAGGRIFGTAASVAAAVMNGASIIRVHDVDQMKDVMRVVDAIRSA